MAYIAIADLNVLLPEAYRIKAVDDDRDGEPTTAEYTAILDAASEEVDSYLETAYTVPISPIPAVVKRACVWFALELLYGRRNVENTQVTDRADGFRMLLKEYSDGSKTITATSSAASNLDTWEPHYNNEELARILA